MKNQQNCVELGQQINQFLCHIQFTEYIYNMLHVMGLDFT